jgi:hypothetical protein
MIKKLKLTINQLITRNLGEESSLLENDEII